jgi:hypothetical protein
MELSSLYALEGIDQADIKIDFILLGADSVVRVAVRMQSSSALAARSFTNPSVALNSGTFGVRQGRMVASVSLWRFGRTRCRCPRHPHGTRHADRPWLSLDR